eukprot:TRINITY_DN198_c1_g1_i1.p1 TRINITY_DN198_c1_g1~~TRINITY_DN198_c1_g1_i1.p1  ORF type:complete len:409 (-),score=92.62 TRINITY_DN198_c1_g1_i1:7-1233(-)
MKNNSRIQKYRPKILCHHFCLFLFLFSVFFIYLIDYISVQPNFIEFKDLKKVDKVDTNMDDWIHAFTKGRISQVNYFHKGLAKKFEVIFESGHVASAKPIAPEQFFDNKKEVKFDKLIGKQQRALRRAEWEYQGFSEITGYHVDKILGFHKKPPIVGRKISSKILYENDESWSGFFNRLLPGYEVEMALVPWISRLERAIPRISIKNYLVVNKSVALTSSALFEASEVSDKLVFDYIIDDHDTQGIQNWKADGTGQLLHWDSGLGWRDGPFSHSSCKDILCGTKEWKGIGHHDPNPPECERICRFRKSTIDRLKHFLDTNDKTQKIPYLLDKSLKSDPLYPVFNLGIFRYYNYDNNGKRTTIELSHLHHEIFYYGLETRVATLLEHVDECIDKHGEDRVYLDHPDHRV